MVVFRREWPKKINSSNIVLMMVDKNNQTDKKFHVLRGKKAGLPAFVMIDTTYGNYLHKEKYPWYLCIKMPMEELTDQRLPTDRESDALNSLEDSIQRTLDSITKVCFIGRITWNGYRELLFYLDTPKEADKALQELAEDESTSRKFEHRIKKDETWSSVSEYLK